MDRRYFFTMRNQMQIAIEKILRNAIKKEAESRP